jgi:hypothetical protein
MSVEMREKFQAVQNILRSLLVPPYVDWSLATKGIPLTNSQVESYLIEKEDRVAKLVFSKWSSYQFSLMNELNPYRLSKKRGMNIISQIKERIVCILRYWGVYSIGIGVHLRDYLFFGNQPYAFRSGRIIPLTKRTVATPAEFSCPCWNILPIFRNIDGLLVIQGSCKYGIISTKEWI